MWPSSAVRYGVNPYARPARNAASCRRTRNSGRRYAANAESGHVRKNAMLYAARGLRVSQYTGKHADAHQVLGECADALARIEVGRAPPTWREGDRGGVPPQDRRVENRVVGIVRDAGVASRENRMRVDRRENQIRTKDPYRLHQARGPDRPAAVTGPVRSARTRLLGPAP